VGLLFFLSLVPSFLTFLVLGVLLGAIKILIQNFFPAFILFSKKYLVSEYFFIGHFILDMDYFLNGYFSNSQKTFNG